jgi:uncharacterized protein (DUF302 family)
VAGADSGGVTTKLSPHSVADTVSKLSDLATAKGLQIFAVIDHSGEAARVALEMRDTKVVIFGSPKAGTPAMVEVPLLALDLPLKVLVWDDEGQTKVSYTDPAALAKRYQVPADLAAALAGIDPLTDAVVAE